MGNTNQNMRQLGRAERRQLDRQERDRQKAAAEIKAFVRKLGFR